jgi:hypothetical protein
VNETGVERPSVPIAAGGLEHRGLSAALTQYLGYVFGAGKSFVATDFGTGDSGFDVEVIKKAVWRHNELLHRHENCIRDKRVS